MLGTLIFIGWSASGPFPPCMGTIPSETIPARYVATSLGMAVGIGELLRGVAGPAVAGRAADHHGLAAPVMIQGDCALVGHCWHSVLREMAPARVSTATAAAPVTLSC
jgi:MFS transporter, ACS family, hexuronate transporter